MKKVKDSIALREGHYYIDLPFRTESVKFPNNDLQALQRLNSLKRKLTANQGFREDYTTFMNSLLNKGYAERVPQEDLKRDDGKVWYIPHHGVYHSRKPDKIRVVFDCTATYGGVSLNDTLLQGPNLTSSLLGVLLRFRQEEIALMSDVEAMIYQVMVPQKDTDCLRFLWWPKGNLNSDPVPYRMKVHLFGAVSSPSCASAALQQTADDNKMYCGSGTAEVVRKNFYVDDFLKSVSKPEEAITLIRDLVSLCARGGFHLTKWISNDHTVLNSIPVEERTKGLQLINLNIDDLPSEHALGVHWDTESDCLSYNVKSREPLPTRRHILSTVSSVYDPLGLAAPYIITAKVILQDLCRQGVGWDDTISGKMLKLWLKWHAELPLLSSLKFPRCYKPSRFGDAVSFQMHVFSDASDVGYGVAVYLRMQDRKGQVHCTLLMGKSRVAPLRKITVPRMELTAATVAVRMAHMIQTEIEYPVDEIFYWTDSMSVLRYICNQTSRFHTFVANRLTLIHEVSTPDQWRYVESAKNPADKASRGLPMERLLHDSSWPRGPDFLWELNSKWPSPVKMLNVDSEDPEVKASVNTLVVQDSVKTMNSFIEHHSDWRRLKTSAAWILTATHNLQLRCKQKKQFLSEIKKSETNHMKQQAVLEQKMKPLRVNDPVQVRSLLTKSFSSNADMQAERALIAYEQNQHFKNEIEHLRSGSNKAGVSKLRKLDPVLIEGIVRVGGRLDNASFLSYDAQHQIILPKKSYISQLIVKDAHILVGHSGKNAMLNVIQKKYWILGVKSLTKSLLSKCVICRKYNAQISQQKMADLPKERVTPDLPAFCNTGMDYFGPIFVKRGRSQIKRYGVVFTCMASRAVHLEVACSLDTDSCVNAIRRFIARRGPVKTIRSDNGTNLVGSEREMREEIQRWNQSKINQALLQKGITWYFNPPSASHFGGVWEHLIRSVRKILYSLMQQQTLRLDDESLQTLFCEIEAILNGRPISVVPDQPNDMQALTPNHLLLLRAGEHVPPGIFCKTDNYVKRRWRQIQYLADVFWKRWIREYLPMLQERQKWLFPKTNIQAGDIVLVVDSSPRNSWALAKVIEVHHDKKGFVRVVKVKTKSAELVRPVHKLCLILEAD